MDIFTAYLLFIIDFMCSFFHFLFPKNFLLDLFIISLSFLQGIAGRSSRCTNIGVKRMGQSDNGPFLKALRAKQRYSTQKAATICFVWEMNLKDPIGIRSK